MTAEEKAQKVMASAVEVAAYSLPTIPIVTKAMLKFRLFLSPIFTQNSLNYFTEKSEKSVNWFRKSLQRKEWISRPERSALPG